MLKNNIQNNYNILKIYKIDVTITLSTRENSQIKSKLRVRIWIFYLRGEVLGIGGEVTPFF